MKKELKDKEIRTVNITLGVPVLDRWLRYHFMNHHVTEIIIKTNPTDTIMTIELKGEDFPTFETLDLKSKESIINKRNKND